MRDADYTIFAKLLPAPSRKRVAKKRAKFETEARYEYGTITTEGTKRECLEAFEDATEDENCKHARMFRYCGNEETILNEYKGGEA